MKFKGTVTHAIDKSGTSKNGSPFVAWQYRILENGDIQYPQSCLIDVFGDRTSKPVVGDEVEVDFNLSCSEYEGKLYGKNNAWKIVIMNQTSATPPPPGEAFSAASIPPAGPEVPPGDDLPFN